jgi:hypothetical protein
MACALRDDAVAVCGKGIPQACHIGSCSQRHEGNFGRASRS